MRKFTSGSGLFPGAGVAIVALAVVSGPPVAAQGSANAGTGAAYFTKNCAVCHSLNPGKPTGIAPNLNRLAGRASGAGPAGGSAALRQAKIVWNAKTLDKFLADPTKAAPGISMVIPVKDAGSRAALVAYLLSVK